MRLSYPILRRLGLGAHLAVIVGLAAVPTAFLVIEFMQSQKREAVEDAQIWTRTAAMYAAAQHRDDIADTHALLAASAPQINARTLDANHCITSPGGGSRTIWLIASDDTTCAPDNGFPLTQATQQEIIQQAPPEGFGIVGPLEIIGGNLSLFGVLTMQADDGSVWHIIRAVELTWAPIFQQGVPQPLNLVVMEFDTQGRIFYRDAPTKFAKTEAELPIFDVIRPFNQRSDPHKSASVTATDIDGTKRIFGVAPIPEANSTVVVGLSHEAVLAQARKDLVASLAIFAAVIALSALLAWLIIERKVLRSIRNLRDAAVATANGEDGRQVEIVDGPYELRELAEAFNEMTAKLQHQALHDQLTGLANRRLITQRIEGLQRKNKAFCVLALDLDGFKPVNDTHGHDIGDMVLSEIGRRLSSALPSDVTVGRTGGDEFIALVPADAAEEVPSARGVAAAKILLDEIRHPIDLPDGGQVKIGGCIGISSWPQGDATPEDVIRQADAELYRAKETGRNRYSVRGSGTSETRAA